MSNGRKVSTDALETLGQIIDDTQKRDAIHLAVLPMVATEKLFAGQDVGLVEGGASTKAREHLGIVDPFLKSPVMPGERFWMVLYPRMVTSLRHVWSHPAFADEASPTGDVASDLSQSKRVIQRCADDAGISYDEMIEAARSHVTTGEYMCEGGRWEGHSVGDEFWDHYERVTGEKVAEEARGGIFTCSC